MVSDKWWVAGSGVVGPVVDGNWSVVVGGGNRLWLKWWVVDGEWWVMDKANGTTYVCNGR